MDVMQIVLLVVVVVVAVILVVIGISLIGILKDAKESLRKADLILEDVGFLTRSLVRGSSTLAHLTTSLESGMQLIGMVTKLVGSKSKKND